MFDLTEKTVLVTGASGGIGAEIAKTLHSRGAVVGLSGTRKEALDALAVTLGDRVHVLPCNLGSPEDVEALIPAATEAMGGIDILVNNAGLTRDGLILRMKDEGSGDRGQPQRFLPPVPRRGQGHDEKAQGAHHQHHVHRWPHGQPRPDKLLCIQGRHDRHVQVFGAGTGEPWHHRQLRGAGLHRDGDDR
jgi:hypothetical protein